MTPEREKYLREDAMWGTLWATKRLEVFAALDEERAANTKLRALEKALRRVRDFGHTEDCNSYMGWGNNDACDCPTKDVKAALKALDEGRDA